jgi:HEAT repeat protein
MARALTHPRARSIALLTALTLATLATPLAAQTTGDQGARERLRQRYNPRRGSGDFGEALRKLRSERADERLDGARMLAASDDAKAVEYLLTAATDADMRVRIKAIDELGNRRATEATPLFIQQLFLRETDPVVRQRVLVALGKIGDPRSTQPICDFLSQELDGPTRGTAIFALGEIGDDDAIGVLSKLANQTDDPVTSRLADEARRKIMHRAPPAVEIPALADDRNQ